MHWLLKQKNFIPIRLSPASIMIWGFVAIILLGTVLLKLPIAVRHGVHVSLLAALFTAVSATCVTGLTVVDTLTTWSIFGRIVIMCLVQIGGLGFMSVTTIFFFVINSKIGLSQRLLIMQSLSLKDIQGVVQLIRHILFGTFIFQSIGTLFLWVCFYHDYGIWKGLGMGVFHSIAAFSNAGFDIISPSETFPSFSIYSGNLMMMLTLVFLVIMGGLGFFVWEDIWRNRKFQKLHLHSKMVLTVSCILLLGGGFCFFWGEQNNPDTIGNLPFLQQVTMSLFQSAMTRSSGLSMINQAFFSKASQMLSMLLMFIGGSAGSTGGGIKNVTAAIIFLSALRSLRGKKTLSVFGNTIPDQQIISALSIFIFALTACFIASILIFYFQPKLPFWEVIFEVISATATCGLSLGITPCLSPESMIVIIFLMFLGRVGIITFGMAAFFRRHQREKTKYPDTWVMM